jgi:hypothetical protein
MEETSAMVYHMEVYRDTGLKVSSYSTPSTCEKPLATNIYFYFLMLPSTTFLIL